jgi:hypothetical protein
MGPDALSATVMANSDPCLTVVDPRKFYWLSFGTASVLGVMHTGPTPNGMIELNLMDASG